MNALIVYYSYSGTTKRLAEALAAETNGDLLELIPEKGYSLDYNTAVKEIRQQIGRGYCPKLISEDKPVASYDVIFVGSPNWLGQFAPPVLTFLRTSDLHGKTVVPFCTHGGGGFGIMEQRFKEECAGANLKPGLALTSNFTENDVKDWLAKNLN